MSLITIDLGVEMTLDYLSLSAPLLFNRKSPLRWVLGAVLKKVLNISATEFILRIDLTSDSIKAAMQKPIYEERAYKLYEKAMAKSKYSEEKKEAIRREYFDLLDHAASGL